jgi:hypothetical protein
MTAHVGIKEQWCMFGVSIWCHNNISVFYYLCASIIHLLYSYRETL